MSFDFLADLQPVKTRRPWRQLAILVGASLIYGAAVIALIATRADMMQLPPGWMPAAGAAWLIGFLVPAYLAVIPAPGSMMHRWFPAAIAAVLGCVIFVGLGLMVHPGGAASLDYSDKFVHGHGCLELGLGVALVPVIAGALFLRGALPVGARWTAACLGAAGGALGGLVLHLHCRITDPWHQGFIHGGVVVVASALSAALVPRATVPR